MAFDLENAENLLNKISLNLMMISSDNLVEISDILGQVESLDDCFAVLDSEAPGRIINDLAESLRAIIRGQVIDVERAMTLAGDGISMLQELARALPVQALFKGDVTGWAADLAALVATGGLMADDCRADCGGASVRPDNSELYGPGKSGLPATLSLEHFKREFLAEIEEIQVALVAIEQKADPLAALAGLGGKFRTLLGAASLLQMENIAQLAFNAGDLLEYVAAEHVPYSTAVTDILLKACGYLLNWINSLQIDESGSNWLVDATADAAEAQSFADQLWMARQGIMPVSRIDSVTSGAAAPGKSKKIGEILIEKGLISEGDLGGLIEAQQNARKVTLGDILLAEKFITREDLEEALEEQRKTPGRKLGEILVSGGKVDPEHIDIAMKNQEEKRETKLGEFLVKSKIGAPEKVALALREQKQSEAGGSRSQAMTQTVKVETMKLDGLIDLVGELVIAQSLITSNAAIMDLKEQKLTKDLSQVSRITSELQRNAMSLRMVQIGPTFQKMNRLVRDLAHKFEKDVKFETLGNDTEIDRNMVESIYDPLVHLVRNALDHGLETPLERRAQGKSPQGLIRLRAYHQGGNVVIELSDDGRGLDTAKALEKAIAQGLVSPSENLTEAAIHALVFQPGLSTAEQISDISGRGVGMDVVKKSIEALRGKVDFSSVQGRGSTMIIRLPLTLAIIDGMIVRVGRHRYILPTISILESFRPVPSDYFTVKNQGEMIRVRERMVPMIRLDRIVDAEGAVVNPDEALVVVVENEGELRCLLVDEVLGKQEVVIKSLGERLKHVRSLAGGTILGDGRVGLILDVAGLFEGAAYGAAAFGPAGGIAAADDWNMDDDASWGPGA